VILPALLPEGLVEGLASAPGEPRPERENLRIDLTHNTQIHVVCKWAFVQTLGQLSGIGIGRENLIGNMRKGNRPAGGFDKA
jgi:hypothetical protein